MSLDLIQSSFAVTPLAAEHTVTGIIFIVIVVLALFAVFGARRGRR